jgi:hypothetical protein
LVWQNGNKLVDEAAAPGAKGIVEQSRNIRSLQASFQNEVLKKALALTNWALTNLARMNLERTHQQIQSFRKYQMIREMGRNQKREMI